jgi:threonine dehydratase
LAVTIPERPGSLQEFCHAIGARSITEFNYRYAKPGDAHIFVGVELRDVDTDRDALLKGLVDRGYPVVDMTDNEMAKIHIRYMVGGRSGSAGEELLYRLNFPERPGALLRFLTHMGEHWNISLFHYRNHGADYGRVLIGVQVPREEREAFQSFLSEIGYDYVEESNNPAYDLFLN